MLFNLNVINEKKSKHFDTLFIIRLIKDINKEARSILYI